MAATQRFELNSTSIPTGRSCSFQDFSDGAKLNGVALDDCFAIDDDSDSFVVRLQDPQGEVELHIWQDQPCQFLQLFTPPHRNSIAVEPMTCLIDAFNNKAGLTELAVGDTLTLSCGVKLMTLSSASHFAGQIKNEAVKMTIDQ